MKPQTHYNTANLAKREASGALQVERRGARLRSALLGVAVAMLFVLLALCAQPTTALATADLGAGKLFQASAESSDLVAGQADDQPADQAEAGSGARLAVQFGGNPIGDGLDEYTYSIDLGEGFDVDYDLEGGHYFVGESETVSPEFEVIYGAAVEGTDDEAITTTLDPSKYSFKVEKSTGDDFTEVALPLALGVGKYRVTVTPNEGSGLTGTLESWFEVFDKYNINGAKASYDDWRIPTGMHEYVFNSGQSAVPIVTTGNVVLPESAYVIDHYQDYSYAWVTPKYYDEFPTMPGRYECFVTGVSPYYGEAIVSFYVMDTIGKAGVSGLDKKRTFTGSAQVQSGIVVKYNSKVLVYGKDYTLSYKNNKNAGTASVVINGKGVFTGSKTVTFTIAKAKNTVKFAKQTKKANAKTLKKKAVKITIKKATKAKGGVTYSLAGVVNAKYKKNFSINKTTGKITVKRNTKPGTYKLKVKATAKGNKNYRSASVTAVITIKVK